MEELLQIFKKWLHSRSPVCDINFKFAALYNDNFSPIFRSGYCSQKDVGFYCYHGLRLWNCSILSGPLFSVWNEVKSVLKEKALLKVFSPVSICFWIVLNKIPLPAYVMVKVGCVNFGSVKIFGLIIPLGVESRIVELLMKHYGNSREFSWICHSTLTFNNFWGNFLLVGFLFSPFCTLV